MDGSYWNRAGSRRTMNSGGIPAHFDTPNRGLGARNRQRSSDARLATASHNLPPRPPSVSAAQGSEQENSAGQTATEREESLPPSRPDSRRSSLLDFDFGSQTLEASPYCSESNQLIHSYQYNPPCVPESAGEEEIERYITEIEKYVTEYCEILPQALDWRGRYAHEGTVLKNRLDSVYNLCQREAFIDMVTRVFQLQEKMAAGTDSMKRAARDSEGPSNDQNSENHTQQEQVTEVTRQEHQHVASTDESGGTNAESTDVTPPTGEQLEASLNDSQRIALLETRYNAMLEEVQTLSRCMAGKADMSVIQEILKDLGEMSLSVNSLQTKVNKINMDEMYNRVLKDMHMDEVNANIITNRDGIIAVTAAIKSAEILSKAMNRDIYAIRNSLSKITIDVSQLSSTMDQSGIQAEGQTADRSQLTDNEANTETYRQCRRGVEANYAAFVNNLLPISATTTTVIFTGRSRISGTQELSGVAPIRMQSNQPPTQLVSAAFTRSSVIPVTSGLAQGAQSLPTVSSAPVIPLYDASVPQSSAQQLQFSAQQPQFSAQQPQFSAQQPQFSAQQPQFSAQQPHFSAQQPQFSAQQPQFSAPVQLSAQQPVYSDHVHQYTAQQQTGNTPVMVSYENRTGNANARSPPSRAQDRAIQLRDDATELIGHLTPAADDESLTKGKIIGLHKSKLGAIENERRELRQLLDKYLDNTSRHEQDSTLVSDVQGAIADAKEWCMAIRDLFNSKECGSKDFDKELFSGLKKFTEDSEISIFEFLRRFEAYTSDRGDQQKRADLLFNEYLHRSVQDSVIEYRQDYDLLKNALINIYGDVRKMTGNLLNRVIKEHIPTDPTASLALFKYLKKLNSVIQSIQEMFSIPGMPTAELENHIHGLEFLQQLKEFLPYEAKMDYLKQLKNEGFITTRLRGKRPFTAYVSIVKEYLDLHEGAAPPDTPRQPPKRDQVKQKPKQKEKSSNDAAYPAVTSVDSEDESDSEACKGGSAHFLGKEKKSQDRKSKDGQKSPKGEQQKQGKKNLRFPCGLHNGDHELGECSEFFKMKPFNRKLKMKKHTCLYCMGPKSKCKSVCTNKIPKELICEECKDWGKSHSLTPSNLLFCNFKMHAKSGMKEIKSALKSYLKSFDSNKIQEPICLAAHANISAYLCDKHESPCKCKPKRTKTSEPRDDVEVPCFDTESGEKCKVQEGSIIKDSPEDVSYVTQILRVNNKDVLVFYDRGANHHLIDGALAEELNLKVVSDKPSTCGTLGDNRLVSDYGSYALRLGPTPEGEFFELTAQGFDLGIEKFPYCNLKEINKEVEDTKKLPSDSVLPKTMGGVKVGILIGLKAPGLEPKLQFQLPSGLGVYKSLLKDKYGSRLCYGGPHELITKQRVGKKKSDANFSRLKVYFTNVRNSYQKAFYPALSRALEDSVEQITEGFYITKSVPATATIVSKDGNVTEPTAISEDDLQQMGYPPSDFQQTVGSLNLSQGCPDLHAKCECTDQSNATVFKASVPIAKRKEYIDLQDQALIDDVRCPECKRCKICAKTNKEKMMSLNEKNEQIAIESSVHLDLKSKKVFVQLPFVKDPVKFLTKKHKGPNNYNQALKIYQSQCRKNEATKEGIRKTHEDLVKRGFMMKKSDLTAEEQKVLEDAKFTHIMPWRSVYKEDSLSTPVRMVVDASVTGLNEILAKGVNGMQRINDIILRSRCRKHVWSSDISKLYNQLHLSNSALPYGCFLYHDSLDQDVKPEIYVMKRAWYGVSSTGNQSAVALALLSQASEKEFPEAVNVIENDIYVDDAWSGANDKAKLQQQISQVKGSLEKAQFKLKYVVESGEPPTEDATSDGTHVKILGYLWAPEQDYLSPGFSEVNFNTKRRGVKRSNPFPVKDPEDLTKLMSGMKITRRMVFSKIAEFYDPCGFWEPYKLQLKLDNSMLNGYDWDSPLESELEELWKQRFQEFLSIPSLKAPRCLVPDNAVDPDKIRLIAISDAAEKAGGVAIYAGWELPDGTYSCQLLLAKSKILHQTVPRNELEAVKLMTEAVQDVKRSLGDRVSEVLYFTDSTVAMCWAHSVNKRLRLYTLYRVADIRNNMLGREKMLEEELPLYHIDGKLNVADLLTKKHNLTPADISEGSLWQTGYDWMRLPLADMPVTRYSDLVVKKAEEQIVEDECFPSPYLTGYTVTNSGISSHCPGCDVHSGMIKQCYGCLDANDHCEDCHCLPPFSSFFVSGKGQDQDPDTVDLRHYGYKKGIGILAQMIRFASEIFHKSHVKKDIVKTPNCLHCDAFEKCKDSEFERDKQYRQYAFEYLLREETKRLKASLPASKLKLFTEIDGILYYQSRLSEENAVVDVDLGFEVFFDHKRIKSLLPVVSANSDLFLVYALYVHEEVRPHSGVEALLRECMLTLYPIHNPRRILQSIRKSCTRCRLIARKTLELRVMNHPDVRTTISPPFFNCMIDTVFGFRSQSFKNARGKTSKMYCLVIVCLLTGAVNMLALEGLETQDIIQALERHAFRHGMPSKVFVDNGTQLISLERANFELRDFQCRTKEALGLEVVVSSPKAHEERGRVEAKVKTLRDMMKKLVIEKETAMTVLQWETVFAKMSSMINDLPLAKGSTSSVTDLGWNVITPNRLMLGRNNNRSLEGSIRVEHGHNFDRLLKRNNEILKVWYQMFIDKLHHLIHRPKKWVKDDPVRVDDIVIFVYNENPAMDENTWKLGRVEKILKPTQLQIKFPGKFVEGEMPKMKTIVRSPRSVCVIQAADESSIYLSDPK